MRVAEWSEDSLSMSPGLEICVRNRMLVRSASCFAVEVELSGLIQSDGRRSYKLTSCE
jgi:hypothetical protein